MVIAFRGTDGLPLLNIDWYTGNIPAAAGIKGAQMSLAIQVVADVLAVTPASQVTLTGHSLGGGLASAMAVFFDLYSYTWAPALFDKTMTSTRQILGVVSHTGLVDKYFKS